MNAKINRYLKNIIDQKGIKYTFVSENLELST